MLNTFWAEILDSQDPLMAVRQKYWDRFEAIGLPRPKQEAFQYLSKIPPFPKPAEQKEGFAKGDLVFVDGFLQETQLPAPLIYLPIAKAIRSYGLFLQARLAKLSSEETDPLAALNGAFQGRGAFLYVPPKCKAALHLTHLHTSDAMASPRLHIYLGRGSELRLTQTSEGKSGFCNSMIDFVLDEGARCLLVDRSEGDFQAIRATLKKESHFKTVFLGKQIRVSIKVQLLEERSEAELFGLLQLSGDRESHIHASVEHAAPHTRSRQHFKSVLSDRGKYSFEGKIHVRPAAQKTEAYQLNNALLLSDEASANAKPNLEIFADDVKASHGATVGQLDPEHLFYLRSRGLDLEQAKQLLIEGFCKEIIDHAR
jgi:Fe-S cluster assembly protein SufD